MKSVVGKVALVTGGASGMGKEWAKRLAKDGARVVIWDIQARALKETQIELSKNFGTVETALVNLLQREQIYLAAQKIEAHIGPVDILINNAGIGYTSPFLSMSDSELTAILDLNLKSIMWTCKAFLPHMLEVDDGHIVNVAAASALIGMPFLSAYAASKWGLRGLTESLRLEIQQQGKFGIKWTLFCPSYVSTDMGQGAKTPLGTPMLSPEEAVLRAYKAFLRDKYLVCEPALVKIAPLLNALLPTQVFDRFSNFMGIGKNR